ncbi:MAG: hypothetical protein ACI4XJ_03125 [Eubacteriales bacterium]
MSDRFTVLWEKEREVLSREERNRGAVSVIDLQIDRSFRTICPDPMLREAFLDVLVTPLQDENEIKKRCDVIREFKKTPELLVKLTELVRRLGVSKKAWDSERARLVSSRRTNPQDKSLSLLVAREQLVLSAHFLRVVFLCLREIHESLNMMGASSEWLVRLKESTRKIACTPDAEKLLKLAADMERDLPNAHTYEVEFKLNDEMRVSPVFLCSYKAIQYANGGGAKVQKKGKNAFLAMFGLGQKEESAAGRSKAADEIEEVPRPVYGMELDWSLDMATRAVNELNRYLTSLIRVIFDRYSSLEDEFYFCKAALMYIERFEERGIGYVYPELHPACDGIIGIKGLSDLLLLTESMSVSSVVPNDVGIDPTGGSSGMLVIGKNNSGKTVYLRSVGTAVLLAQCGLPIPAKSAKISVRSRIYTTFAKAEGELVPVSSAGRFEEEVIQLSGILSGVGRNSLVLLNETFQTTSYDEGSDGMKVILNYLTRLGCGYIFVTHLSKLISDYEKSGEAAIMKTSDDARTRYMISRVR